MKTIKLIESYYKLLEQDGVEGADVEVDATEVAAEVPEVPEEVQPLSTVGEIRLTYLAALAFTYEPSLDEASLIEQKLQEYGQSDPKRVQRLIQDFLQSSNKALEKELNEV
tara:strand:- start:1956 stop:2288 length:333 start_codon:yes stop_codon:yes gene_type:complete